MKINKNNPAKPTVTLTLYSDVYCDEVRVKEEHYQEFMEEFRSSSNFDEAIIADLLYFAEEMFHRSSCDTTKQRLRLKIADLVDVIPPDDLVNLKHFELKPLLNASKENYLAIFNNMLLTDNSMVDKKLIIETVDPN